MEKNAKSIVEMARGAILERINYEMARVMDNILDANTKPTAKRKLTVTLTFTPDDERATIARQCGSQNHPGANQSCGYLSVYRG